MKRNFIFLFCLFAFATTTFAQERYTSEVFTDDQITITSDVQYATNATIFGLLFDPSIDEFVPEPLFVDVYQPDQSIDTVQNRPVVMVVHGGDGLPRIINNACWGDKTDSVTVSTAKRLARMGYVAVAPNYRMGWNPLSPNQDAFLDGLVDAGVRVQQDLKACARWLRKNVAEDGNTYNIHPDQLAIWGTSSTAGTYSGFAAYIKTVEELSTPTYFVLDQDGVPFNTFNEMEAGNVEGTVVGMNAAGDTTNYVNWPGYSSDFQLAVLGSAISLDSGIVQAGEAPMIQLGNPNSIVTQIPAGPIQLPTTGEVVAIVSLSQGVIAEANAVGVNQAWIDAGLSDPYTMYQKNDPSFGQYEGWFPLYGNPENEYPWVHWDTINCPVSAESFDVLPTDPGVSFRDKALAQIDSMTAYFGVRACVTFGLGCASVTSIKDKLVDNNLVKMWPNPTANLIRLETNNGKLIEEVVIHGIDGRLVRNYAVNSSTFEHSDINLSPGVYSVQIRMQEGTAVKKLVINE